ncbi:acyltransferase family protein [Ekhidna sp.]
MIAGRRYDIDWLRVMAIGLLLIYHIAIGFQPWGVFIGFIQTNEPLEAIWIPMSLLNIWRIPLLFFVSGMGVWFAIQRRSWKKLLIERSKRILLPFIFGILVIVPIHVFIWQKYYTQELQHTFSPAHLWFLGNIFVYVLALFPIFFFLKRNSQGIISQNLKKLFSHSWSLLLLMVPFILEAEIMAPQEFEVYAMTWHGFVLGFVAFLAGFCCVFVGDAFWENVKKQRWILLIHAILFYLIRLLFFELRTPNYLMAVESCLWVFTVFGFGYMYLNKPSRALSYLSQAAYPVYIVHMVFIYIGSYVLFPMDISVGVLFILLNIFTLTGSMLTYEFIIRRIKFLRPLFGLKNNVDRFGIPMD